MTVLEPQQRRALAAERLRRKAQRAQPIRLSAAQERLWLLDAIESGTAAYNVPYAFELRGPLDECALRRALATICRRHDVLRARIEGPAGEAAYRVDEDFAFEVRSVDVTADELRPTLAAECARPFDLRSEVPLRVLLARRGPDQAVLLVTLHHIATDGWSMGIFTRELGVLYAAHRGAAPALLADLPCTYADFAQWERAGIDGSEHDDRLRFWSALLADAPAPLAFIPRSGSAAGVTGALAQRLLGARLSAGLGRMCRERGCTVFAALFAAFSAVLGRCSGRDDFIVGTAFANRTRPELEELIGFFVNTLPLRVRIDGDPSFADWLGRAHLLALDAFDNADVPFQALVDLARPPRAAPRTPLVNVMFVFNNAPGDALTLAGLDVKIFALERTTAKFDLTLEVTPTGDDFQIGIEYRTSLFDAAAVAALSDALVALVASAVDDPTRRLSELALLDPAERNRQLRASAGLARSLTGARIEELFARQAERQPAALAIVDGPRRLTYAELSARAGALARRIRVLDASADRIGICFERGCDAVVAMLAVLRAGAAYVPLDPEYPPERLAQMLSAAGVTLVLTNARTSSRVVALSARVLEIDARGIDLDALEATPAAGYAGAQSPAAYVMFTSGSTGKPKGVLISHAGIERLVTDPDYAPIVPNDAVAHAATLAFDAATFEIWAPLLNGARIIVVSKTVLLEPHALRSAIERDGITIMFATTAFAREVARSAPATFARLRRLLVGGEALDARTVRELRAAAPATALCNIYGPTEATTFATWHPLDTEPTGDTIPIGRPIVNTQVRILDARRRLLPAGVPGELYIGGAGVALGYLNDPAANAAKFIADPFEPGTRLYATGDRARYRSDGAIEFLGRDDQQVKRRGFRIEPAEIEAALRSTTGVLDAIIVMHANGRGEPALVAHVAVNSPSEAVETALAQHLRERLPAFMLPDAVVAAASLPRRPNGKIDRDALDAATPARRTNTAGTIADEAQAELQALWETFLDIRPIGPHANFFDAGGNSLLAIRMLAAIEQRYGVRVSPAVLFEQPTLEHLARAMCTGTLSGERREPFAFNRDGTAQPLFFFHGSIGGGGFYCRSLADGLGADRPLYAIAPHGDRDTLPPPLTLMAADNAALIRRIQPRGPYLLGGYCNGGLVALETARRLIAQGERVAHVVLIDVVDASTVLRRLAETIECLGSLARIDAGAQAGLLAALARIPYQRKRFAAHPDKRQLILGRLRRLAGGANRENACKIDAAARLLEPWNRLSETYVPRRYGGSLTVLQTRAADGACAALGWRKLGPRVAVRAIPGDHLSCITEFIGDTARALAAAIESHR